jgi:nucleotide-binding universal stress UspA family protein
MFRRVLVATDLSPAAANAVRTAHASAKAAGAKLAVCHVIPNVLPTNMLFPQANSSAIVGDADLERRAGDALEAHVDELLGQGADVEILIQKGDPQSELARVAETWGADLLVTGSHGRTGVERILLGSVAEKTVRLAPCSVLVVRSGGRSDVVLGATDLSDPSLPAIRAAAAMAQQRQAELHVMHAVDVEGMVRLEALGGPFGVQPPPREVVQAMHDSARAALDGAIAHAGVKATPHLVEGSAAAAIVRTAEEIQAGLVVIATHGRTGIARVLLGSVAEKVVRVAPCSVLAVRERAVRVA